MSTDAVTYADVEAGVRAAIARYAHAVDDGRPDDLVATFCPEGTADIPGSGVVTGTDALRAFFSGLRPGGQSRHLVVNILVTDWDGDHAAAVSDVIVLGRPAGGKWSVQLVGRYNDTLHRHHDAPGDLAKWLFHSRTLRFAD
jgi:hypothetical protein